MLSESNYEEGAVIIFCNRDNTRKFTGVIDYSEGEETEGFIRVRQVFSETSDVGNIVLVPPLQIFCNG